MDKHEEERKMYFSVLIIIIAMVTTLYLLKKEINIGIIMLTNCIFIILGTKMTIPVIFNSVYKGFLSEKTIGLLLILILIMSVENVMRTSGMITGMVNNLKEIIGNGKAASILLPAVLGLLPSPGGARFSCPMVEEVLGDKTSNDSKAFLNYWFRHIWLDGFILYPSIILASSLVNRSVLNIFLHLLIFTFIHIVLGIIFEGKNIKSEVVSKTKSQKEAFKGFLKGIFPIIFIIVLYICLLNVTKYALHLSAICTLILLFIYNKYNFSKIIATIKQSIKIKFILIIVGVMIFNQFLSNSGLIDIWIKSITVYNIPKEFLFVIIPFITGLTSGIAVSFVSLAFPIIIPLGLDQNIWYIVAAFVSGFIGVMITPLHLCGAMSVDYFKSTINKLLKKVIMPEIIMIVIVILMLYFV